MDNNRRAPDLDEDEVLRCVEKMAVILHELIREGYASDAISGALNMRFIEMSNERAGKEPKPVDVRALFPTLGKNAWDQTDLCHGRMKTATEALQGEGFSTDAIMWSLIAAVKNLLRVSGAVTEEIEKIVGELLHQFHEARRPQVIYL